MKKILNLKVVISKYKNIFAKGYAPNWSEDVFVITKIKNSVPWTYVINDLKGEKIVGTFYAKESQKTNQEYEYEYRNNDRNIDSEIQRQKAIEKNLVVS